jgi:hypothetical protein
MLKVPAHKMSAKAREHFGHRVLREEAPSPSKTATAAATATTTAAATTDAAATAAASIDPAGTATAGSATDAAATDAPAVVGADGPPLPLAADAGIDELARAAATSPNANQRIELIGRIRNIKSGVVVAALRANAASPHPGVRAAAEAAMAQLFGPNWNTTRPVPKPVQRPPSDDKDRGPPGGW